MNCPVCDRSLAPTLSICPTCGAMMRDTVREELQPKITPGGTPRTEVQPRPPAPVAAATPPIPRVKRVDTAGLVAPKTSPTLVEFQNKNAPLPDWRIQLQNAVQQRKGGQPAAVPAAAPQLSVSVATAKPAAIAASEPTPLSSDPRVANALRRIEASQKAFNKPEIKPKNAKPPHSFGVVSPTSGAAGAAPARVALQPKPQLVPPPAVQKRDTNKLPPISAPEPETIVIKQPIARVEKIEDIAPKLDFPEAARIEIKAAHAHEPEITRDEEADEIDDLAPFSMRFGAGLFDMIIAGFVSMLALSPLAFSTTNWWTIPGLLTALGTLAVVSFFYMTACLGFFGKTMGMRLFSLELVDAVENEYPTLRQAAVNSFFFLLSLPLAGAGFVTTFFNEENRAVHDLLSGTIMVKEF